VVTKGEVARQTSDEHRKDGETLEYTYLTNVALKAVYRNI